MSVFETYSKRKNGLPDIYTYEISTKLKNQIHFIWEDFFKQSIPKELLSEVRRVIFDTICREEGKKKLYFSSFTTRDNPSYQVEKYFEELIDAEKILDVVEITFYYIEKLDEVLKQKFPYTKLYYTREKAIQDLNKRFQENGVGYEFIEHKIIRVDNKMLHSEIIQKTLHLLASIEYENINEEYLKAHQHFRFKRNQECLNECLKAFETTMKIICQKNNWPFKENDTAKSLINILISNSFFASYNENHLNAIRQLLEGSIPTIRNKNSGHGQGVNKVNVNDDLASYMLYITGATINLMVGIQNHK